MKNEKKISHHWPQSAKWFSRYPTSNSGILASWTSPFCRFLASFSLKYDVKHSILQGIENNKSALSQKSFAWFVWNFAGGQKWTKEFRLTSNFVAMATQTRIISLCSKTKDYCFHNKKSASLTILQNLTLPAVTIKLYCFKLLFEQHFCLNNRPFFQ